MLPGLKKWLIIFLLLAPVMAKAQVEVFVAASGNDSINGTITRLFSELDKTGFGRYEVRPASLYKGSGILLLHAKDAASYKIAVPAELSKMGPEAIYINADNRTAIFVGNSSLAIQEAIFIYLEQLGFRWFLPGEAWTIAPRLNNIYKPFRKLIAPDYEFRTIANGHGYLNLEKPKKDFDTWYMANRMGGSFSMFLGHNYGNIVTARADIFKQHPEYFASPVPAGTLPVDPKFNVANKDLVKLIIDVASKDVEWQIKNNRSPVFFSMEPSDGGGFCTSPECLAIGNPSDQVFYLANEVAKALKKYPGAWVGTYAYNEHIVPTKYKLEPNVFVMVTNGFNRSKYNTDELLQLWKNKAGKVGVYEYLSVFEGNMDMPGRHNASKTDYLRNSIRNFYNSGARSYQGESTIGWINKGLGQYLLTKLLWDVNVNTDSIKNDFYSKAFEEGAVPMRRLFEAWESYPYGVPFPTDLADWHNWIEEASKAVKSKEVKKRIDQVKIYLHYVVLYAELQTNKSEALMQKILEYTWRTKELAAFATVPALVSLANYSGFPALAYYAGGEQKWKQNNKPLDNDEIKDNFKDDAKKFKKTEGIASYKTGDSFTDLKKVTTIPAGNFLETPHSFWGTTEYVVRINKKGADNYFEISSGQAANPPVDRDVEIHFYPLNNPGAKPVLQIGQRKKIEKEKFSLATLEPGYYSVKVYDHQKMFVLQFAPGIDYSIVMKPEPIIQTTSAAGLNEFYFYVPKGTKRFSVLKAVVMTLESPAKRLLNYENNKAETFDVEVKPGEEGIWTIHNQAGWFYINGVPPYLGSHPSRMLVPSYLLK